MHIAICDDHYADRKQIERLLKKESESRRCTGDNLYVDSFGSAASLTQAPMIYDLFLIDLTESQPNGMEVAIHLREIGVSAPILLCCSSIDYRSFSHIPESILFLDKPIVSGELSAMISTAVVKKKLAKPTIEIRGEQHTHYIHEEDLLYAIPTGHTVRITLADGGSITLLGGMRDLIVAVASCTSFMIVGKDTLVNAAHIREIKGRTLIMDDCKKIPLRLGDRGRIKEALDL